MFMNDDFRRPAAVVEVRVYKVDFSLHRGQVFLSPSLKNKTASQFSQVGNASHIQKNVLRQDSCQAGQDLFGFPALALEVHDIGLHEYSAAVTKHGHGLRGESNIRVIVHVTPRASAVDCKKYPFPAE